MSGSMACFGVRCLALLAALFAPGSLQAGWFRATPLQPVYQALMNEETTLAWQELQLVLRQSESDAVPVERWRPLFQQILNQSECGRRLTGTQEILPASGQPQVTLVIQHKMNLNQDVYQLKIAMEGLSQPTQVSLSDRDGMQWLNGRLFPADSGYAELESQDGVQPIPEGEYLLSVGSQRHVLILATQWSGKPAPPVMIDPDDSSASPFQFSASPAMQDERCQRSRRLWQWLDAEYGLIAPMEAVRMDRQNRAILPESFPESANWLSAVVSERYFQGEIEVETISRATLPVRYLPHRGH
ncbi:DUF2861 family protein [Photobacterium sp. 1_MG-2023]|uniref:DUF2861 family protein n=1 Tax=Photobacterium sp. 1_MG-2023 TaxID=3062646 RepID=UPI0026E1F9B1|nr:DUF2861 family protein [Photobacterium sp. 1_MG-2023]MDO6708176.1 DUF2861 family protein [Photobacterium sp. 1_MG-2023]